MTKNLFLLLLLGFGIINLNYSFAQGPSAPEAFGFEPIDATDMVNLPTGDLNYVLPLMEVPSPEGSFPISINYHGGIAMNQEASWVGLGWNINPGAITRSVIGVPDDWNDGIKSTIINDAGGVGRTSSLTFGVALSKDDTNLSIGGGYNWTNFRSVSGETSYSSSFNWNLGVQGKALKNRG
jgi:hypothetical protein